MKTFALVVVVLLAGCAQTSRLTTTTNAKLANLQEKGEELSEREQQCVRQVVNQTDEQIAQIKATPDAFTASRIHSAKDDRDREVSECRTNADREKAQLSAAERAEYEDQTQQTHDRAALMMILTTSHQREE